MTDTWACNSNQATYLQLGPTTNNHSSGTVFHPEFTYPIFGEAETIYGYRDLRIQLGFTTGSLRPHLLIRWAKSKANSVGTSAEASGSSNKQQGQNGDAGEASNKLMDPVQKTLLEYLPKPVSENRANPQQGETFVAQDETSWKQAFQAAQQNDAKGFRPIGEKVATWSIPSSQGSKGKKTSGSSTSQRHFEVYRCTWDTPGFQAYHQRFRIFTLFYIEAASYIDEEEPGWEFLVLYERSTPAPSSSSTESATEQYHFAGFTSLYRFWTWPDSSRIRLSQFLILPPFQKLGLGTRLYTLVHDWVLLREEETNEAAGEQTTWRVSELTVEDPSELFDRLRDGADIKRLLQPETLPPVPLFANSNGSSSSLSKGEKARLTLVADAVKEGKLMAPLDLAWSEQTRKAYKIAPRQWSRLIEMIQLLLLSSAVEEGDEGRAQFEAMSKAFRLQVKARLYKHNRDVLIQMEPDERKRKLQETYENLLEHDYAELIGVDVDPFLPADRTAGPDGSDEEEEDGEEVYGVSKGTAGSSGRGTIRKGNDQAQNGGPPSKVARFA